MFTLHKQEGQARRGSFLTPDGSFETPAFMNVATAAAIKGGLSSYDLAEIKCQILLSNTYHLHLRPGEEVIKGQGGLRGFTGWQGPTLTDSGGFQVFSLALLRSIDDQGVTFSSHIDGRRIFMGPEESIQIQSALGSTIAMAFDECVSNPAEYDYACSSADRTTRWLKRCMSELEKIRARGDAVNPHQMLFGINQGATFDDLRVRHMQEIAELNLDGYAVGGLAVGEEADVMYHILEELQPHMPGGKIRYLMGVGTPANIIEGVWRGIDLFDCVLPSRNARHGHLFTWEGVINLNNARYLNDGSPIDAACDCPVCRRHSRAYLRHLLKANEMLGMRLAVMHNLYFYNTLLERIRAALDAGEFAAFRSRYAQLLSRRI